MNLRTFVKQEGTTRSAVVVACLALALCIAHCIEGKAWAASVWMLNACLWAYTAHRRALLAEARRISAEMWKAINQTVARTEAVMNARARLEEPWKQ